MEMSSASLFADFNARLLAAENRNHNMNNSIQKLKEFFYNQIYVAVTEFSGPETLDDLPVQDLIDKNNISLEMIAGRDLKHQNAYQLTSSSKSIYLANCTSESQYLNFCKKEYCKPELNLINQSCTYRNKQEESCQQQHSMYLQTCGANKRNNKEKFILIDSLITNKSIDLNCILNRAQSKIYSIPKHKRLNMSMIPGSISCFERENNIKSSKGASISINNTSLNLSSKSSKIQMTSISKDIENKPIKLNSPLMSISSTYRTNSSKLSKTDTYGASQTLNQNSSKSINTKPSKVCLLKDTPPKVSKCKRSSNYEISLDLSKTPSLNDFFQGKANNSLKIKDKLSQPQVSIEVLEIDLKSQKDCKSKDPLIYVAESIQKSCLLNNHIWQAKSDSKLKRSTTMFQGMKTNKQSRLIECVKTINKSNHTDQFISHLGEIFNMRNIEIDLQSIGNCLKSNSNQRS